MYLDYSNIITKEFLFEEWVNKRKSQAEIAKELNVHLGTVEKYIKKHKLTRIREKIKYEVKEELFSFDNPIFCYYAGLIISDGYISLTHNRIDIRILDEDVLLKLSQYFSKTLEIPVFAYAAKNKHMIYDFRITSKKLIEVLLKNNITAEDKTGTTGCPIINKKENFDMFVRGFLDGDGNIRGKGSHCIFRFYNHSHRFIEEFCAQFYKYYNYKLSIRPVKNKIGKEVSSRVDFSHNLIKIYENFPEFALQRKRNKIKIIVDDIVHRYEMINHSIW